MPRITFLLGLGLALVALTFALTDQALSPSPRLLVEMKVGRIRSGMRWHEVEAIMGGPPTSSGSLFSGMWAAWWEGPDGKVFVTYNGGLFDDQAVRSASFTRADRPSSVARLRAWLGW